MKSKTQIYISVMLVVLCFGAVFVLTEFIERHRITVPDSYTDEDLAFQGKRLKGYSLGFEGLLADWYWMRSLQYVGDKIVRNGLESINIENLNSLNPRLLYPLLDNATELDPKFITAYSYGATVLPAIDAQQAITLTEKGIVANPGEWRLYQYLGYIYWRLGNYEKASEIYEKGSRIPGAPAFFRLMTAKMKTDSGSRDTARAIYSQMLEEAQDQQTKTTAELRLMALDSLDERDAIAAALQSFREKTGRCASAWPELLPLLRNVQLPGGRDFSVDAGRNLVDPSGSPYILNKQTCRAEIDPAKSKIPLY